MKRWIQAGIVSKVLSSMTVVLLLASNVVAAAPTDKSQKHSYLIGLKPGASTKALHVPGVRIASHWANLEAMHIEASEAAASGLARNPNVSYIEEDRPVYATSDGGSYSDGALTWGLQAVHAEQAWSQNATGTNINICVLDTGIDYDQPEFTRNGVSIIKASRNFVNDGHPDARDGDGHGTHVAGTIAGQTDASGSRIGVAPNVNLYIARVLGDDGSGTTSSVISGMNWCQENNANIASLSLGSSKPSRTEQKVFDLAYMNNMLSIAASGNDSGKIGYPAKYDSVVAVGAVNSNLALAGFSNFGKDQELVAPGVGTLSSVPLGTALKGTVMVTENGTETPYRNNIIEFSNVGNATGPLVECGLADSTTSCNGKPETGSWIAFIDRGNISFTEKLQNVMTQGAAAAIIANNDTANPEDAGSFTLGAEGSWIPTVSISYNSGSNIRSGGLGSGIVNVSQWDYSYFEGTSMATPHVSAVAAIAWSANPSLTNEQIRSVLQNSSLDLGVSGRDNSFGYGFVQADAAVILAKGL